MALLGFVIPIHSIPDANYFPDAPELLYSP
jgi:hypothetical protein